MDLLVCIVILGDGRRTIRTGLKHNERLLKYEYQFYRQTDTGGVVKLVDYYYKKYNISPIDAITKTMV